MKRLEISSLAGSLSQHLCSRNNEIAGAWGIGVLCAAAKRGGAPHFHFKIEPGAPLVIAGYEATRSRLVTDKLVKFHLDSIECRLSFVESGRYAHGAEKYTCEVTVTVTQGDRTGTGVCRVECWPHKVSRELPRAGPGNVRTDWLQRLRRPFG